MGHTTLRDKIWSATLNVANRQYAFSLGDVIEEAGLDKSKRQTVWRTLKAMDELDWIHQSTHHNSYTVSYKLAGLKQSGDDRVERADEIRDRQQEDGEPLTNIYNV